MATLKSTRAPRKSASNLTGASVPAAYKRPDSNYRPAIGKTAEERLATLRATLHTADEKLEAAYDAVERGIVVDTLLDLINHDLLCRAAHPVIMGVACARQPDRADLEQTYLALFPVLAALEGAMALSMDTVVHSTLSDAYNLLDWAHNECDSAALGKLLPERDRAAAFERGRDLAIELLILGQHQHAADTSNAQRTYRPVGPDGAAPDQFDFVSSYLYQVDEDPAIVEGFSAVLSAALSEDAIYNPGAYRVPMAEFKAGKPGDDGTEADADATDATDDAAEVAEMATVARTSKPKAEWWRLDLIDGQLNSAEIMNDMILDTCQFAYTDPDECEQAQERIILLARAVDGYVTSARTDLQEAITLAQKAGHA